MLDIYWPNRSQVEACIRTEAEELSSYVLQVVHEPMHLKEVNINTGDSKSVRTHAEKQLLDHLKLHSRPIPILGDAGSGKSHLIRLIDVQLRNDPETQDWIVKRIPKSSSLRQVLEILLEDMHGEKFDDLRGQINEVGDRLNTGEVADYLTLFMGHRLQEMLKQTQDDIAGIRKSGREISPEDKAKLRRIKQHGASTRLPALLSDPNFKERLINPGQCLYNIAKRLTSGSTGDEIADNEYTIRESDLDFQTVVIDDFAAHTQAYIRDQQLNTNAQKRTEVVELLNEVLSDACRTAFHQFFQFNGGQFQELFIDIRKNLIGKTLVILVEDMAAITAIENDLIDSLLRESTRDGAESLCEIKSAIAVTTGYAGYQRRRNTIASRSGAIEWHIDKSSQDDAEIYTRVENFCGRYLNAARHSLKDIEESVKGGCLQLEPWHDSSIDDIARSEMESFGASEQAYPLFPYNKSALRALTDRYCINLNSELEFNPRTVLSQILIPILRDYRDQFTRGRFPPPGFLGLTVRTKLQSQLQISDSVELEQSLAAAAFWGYQAADKGTLVASMPPAIASAMGMPNLATLLGDTTPSKASFVTPVRPPKDRRKAGEAGLQPVVSPVNDRSQEVDEAFRLKNINQPLAVKIRSELLAILDSEMKYSNKWNCVNINISDFLKIRNLTLIEIPFNTNNPTKTYASFGSEKEFSNVLTSQKYRQFIVALLKKGDNDNQWDQDLYDEYCQYTNFAKDWSDTVLPAIVKQIQQDNILEPLKSAVNSAASIHPSFLGSTLDEKLNILVSHKQAWVDKYLSSTGDEAWDSQQNDQIEKWDSTREKWISYVANKDHAFSRDLVKPYLRQIDESNLSNRSAQSAQKRLSAQLGTDIESLVGITNKDEFKDVFVKMRDLISVMRQGGEFSYPNDEITSTKLINRIEKILDEDKLSEHWFAIGKALKINSPYQYGAFIKAISQFKMADIQPVIDLLRYWESVYKYNLSKYHSKNQANASSSRTDLEANIVKYVEGARSTLVKITSENEVSASEIN